MHRFWFQSSSKNTWVSVSYSFSIFSRSTNNSLQIYQSDVNDTYLLIFQWVLLLLLQKEVKHHVEKNYSLIAQSCVCLFVVERWKILNNIFVWQWNVFIFKEFRAYWTRDLTVKVTTLWQVVEIKTKYTATHIRFTFRWV